MPGLPTGTVTFLFSDIEGSTRLWEEHPEAMRSALAGHDRILQEAIDGVGGHPLKHTGDGMIAVFSTPHAALQASVHAQRRLGSETFEGVGTLKVRMALHTGVAEEREGDYFGPVLNRCARLLAAGHGGQVLVSAGTAQLIGEALPDGGRLRDLGTHRLRDLNQEERVFQLEAEGLATGFPPLRTPDLVPNNLPLQTTTFVGREQELAEVEKLAEGSRLVTLTGVGGAGKTRLALQVAAGLTDRHPDGVWLVELGALADPELVVEAASSALEVPERAQLEPVHALVDHLRGKRALLVLDNCEHLIDAVADLARRLLESVPGVRIIATSRELLGVPGEVAYGVRSLALPGPSDDLESSELGRFDAIRLFAERGEVARPGFRIGPENAGSVLEICRRLDAMPLALELAAARLRTFSPHQIAENLDQRFRLLTGGSRTALPRQQTLEAAIDWSHDLLDPDERILFRRLSVFSGGCSLEAVRSVCAGEDLDELAILDLLPRLVDKSLVLADTTALDVRYRQLETLRQYGRERLAEAGEAEELRNRHAAYFRGLAEEAEPFLRGSKEREWWARLELDLDNIRQAVGWSLETGDVETAMAIASSIWRFWWFRLRVGEGRALLGQVLAAEGTVPDRLRARALLGAGTLATDHGDHRSAFPLLEESAAIYERLYEEAKARGEDLRGRFHRELPAVFINLSVANDLVGNHDECYRLNLKALDLAKEVDEPVAAAVASGNLGESAAQRGEVESARAHYREGIAMSRESGSYHRLGDALSQYASFERALGDPARSLEARVEALKLAAEAGLHIQRDFQQCQLALTRLIAGDADGVREQFLEAAGRLVGEPEIAETPAAYNLLVARVWMEALLGRPEPAAELLAAEEQAAVDFHEWLHLTEREAVKELLVGMMGERELEEAQARGRGLGLDAALERIARP